MNKLFLPMFFLSFLAIGCGDKYNNHPAIVLSEQRERQMQKSKDEELDEALLKSNKVLTQKEAQQIKGYIERRSWQVEHIGEGVFVQELQKGDGKKIGNEQKVILDYSLELINGKKIYSSAKDGDKIVDMKGQNSEVGLIKALKVLSKGSVARVIIPARLAFGIYGDGKSIPKHATLIYEFKIKDVINK